MHRSSPRSWHRRSFVRVASAATAGLALTACGGEGAATGGTASEAPATDSADLPAPDAQGTLFVQQASVEYLTGQDRYLAFGVLPTEMSPLGEDRPVQVYLRRIATSPEETAEVVAGPLETTFSPAVDTGQPVYFVRTDLSDEGLFEIVALAGEDFGTAAIQVVDPQDSRVKDPTDQSPVIPGTEAISAPTATVADDRGVFDICTQDPECGMHEMSLDEALQTGRPVALMFATPQFCQTAVCGPSGQTRETIRTEGDGGDTSFIHSEIYAEEPSGTEVAATPVVDAVAAWGLPTEPWFVTIGADGGGGDRLDGPMPREILQAMLEDLTA